jgi:hypothetical protein
MPDARAHMTPSDQPNLLTWLPDLWVVWADSLGDPEVKIAVLDGPTDTSHRCFRGANLERLNTLVSDAPGTGAMSVHGTHVTSLIFGQPNGPVLGVAPHCHGLLLPVFRDYQEGRLSQLDLARAIEQAVEEGAHIINISGGERSPQGQADQILARAIQLCNDNNVLVVAAVGNDGCECLHVPAALPAVLAVGAAGAANEPLGISNWGQAYRSNGVLAPGENIPGAMPGDRITRMTGSSFATPIVAGFAALLLSIQKKNGQKLDPRAVRKAILESAHKCEPHADSDCRRYLSGSLNISGAYNLIRKGDKTMIPSTNLNARGTLASPVAEAGRGAGALGASTSGVIAAGAEEAEAPQAATAGIQAALSPSAGAPVEPAAKNGDAPAAAVSPPANPTAAVASNPPLSTSAVQPSANGVVPSGNCGCSNGKKQNIFALGLVGYDFGTQARRDSFTQLMRGVLGPTANPYDPIQLCNYLDMVEGQKTWQPSTDYNFNDVVFDSKGNPQIVTKDGTSGKEEPDWSIAYGATTNDGKVTWTNGGPVAAAALNRPNYSESTKLIWTLNLELTPIYAVEAELAYADDVYKVLRAALRGESLSTLDQNYVTRVSVPGTLTSRTVRLFSGQQVPVVVAQPRGMYTWNTNALTSVVISTIQQQQPPGQPLSPSDVAVAQSFVRNFLDKLYYQLRNLGQSSSDRALNFSATNAFQAAGVVAQAINPSAYGLVPAPADHHGFYTLDTVSVAKSPFCRFDSDCWDVQLSFFDPVNILQARLIFQFTVDVSDEMPVTLGTVHSWTQGGSAL